MDCQPNQVQDNNDSNRMVEDLASPGKKIRKSSAREIAPLPDDDDINTPMVRPEFNRPHSQSLDLDRKKRKRDRNKQAMKELARDYYKWLPPKIRAQLKEKKLSYEEIATEVRKMIAPSNEQQFDEQLERLRNLRLGQEEAVKECLQGGLLPPNPLQGMGQVPMQVMMNDIFAKNMLQQQQKARAWPPPLHPNQAPFFNFHQRLAAQSQFPGGATMINNSAHSLPSTNFSSPFAFPPGYQIANPNAVNQPVSPGQPGGITDDYQVVTQKLDHLTLEARSPSQSQQLSGDDSEEFSPTGSPKSDSCYFAKRKVSSNRIEDLSDLFFNEPPSPLNPVQEDIFEDDRRPLFVLEHIPVEQRLHQSPQQYPYSHCPAESFFKE